jgi:hypothetical protein
MRLAKIWSGGKSNYVHEIKAAIHIELNLTNSFFSFVVVTAFEIANRTGRYPLYPCIVEQREIAPFVLRNRDDTYSLSPGYPYLRT